VKFTRILLANLLRKKVRLLLAAGSFAVALFLFAFLGVVRSAFSIDAVVVKADRLIVVNRTSWFNTMPISYKDKIAQIPGVKNVTHYTWFAGVYHDEKDFFPQFAIDPEGNRQVYPEFLIPEEQWQAFLKDRQGAIAGIETAQRFHWKIGDRIPLMARQYGAGTWELNLVGIYRGERPQTDQTQFWFRWDYFNEKVPDEMKGQVGWYIVRVADPSDAVRVAKAIDQQFANSSHETRTNTESVFAADMLKQFGNIRFLIVSIGVVVFFTLLLVTGNTMAIAIRERTRELAVFKAVGFSDLNILVLVLAESLLIAVIGGGLGLLLALLAIPLVASSLSGMLSGLVLSPKILLFGLFLALLVGLLSGLIPGVIAMRMRIVSALRRV
jgi:putative ABC transport system permease protein